MSDTNSSFWADAFNRQVQQAAPAVLPAPQIPQAPAAPAVEEDDDDISESEWLARHAMRVETGSDIITVSANKRTWETNSNKVSDEGILGKQGRKARAKLHSDIASGRYNETSGEGVLGQTGMDANPRAAAATLAALARAGAFDTYRGTEDDIVR